MELSLEKILTYLVGSGTIVGGLFVGIKFIYERLDKRRADKRTTEEKAYDAVWKLYEAAKAENEKLKKEIDDFEKDDSLSRSAISKINQAVRKLGKQMQILDSLLSGLVVADEDTEGLKLKDTLEKEMEILWQKYNELEQSMP